MGAITDTSSFWNVSIVVPVYNSEGTLSDLVSRLDEVSSGVFDLFEVLLVNDGSQDHSWDVICDLVAEYGWVRDINLMRN